MTDDECEIVTLRRELRVALAERDEAHRLLGEAMKLILPLAALEAAMMDLKPEATDG